jgi:putative membrane protein
MSEVAPRRLHPAAVGAEALVQLRGLVVPIVIAAIAGSRQQPSRALLISAAGVLLAVLMAFVRWQTTRWWIAGGAVHLRTGFLNRNEVSVPFERIQAIDTVRGVVQRLFGVVELHVQAAGGGRRGEIVLRAVSLADAELVRSVAAARSAPLAAPEAVLAEAPSWELQGSGLVLAALTSGSLGVLLPVVAAMGQFVDEVFGTDEAGGLVPQTTLGVIQLVGFVLLGAYALSFAGTIVAFAGFRVRREPDRLILERGFLERREASLPVARIHALRIVESPLREPFGLATVRVETAGYGTEAPTAQTLVPVARRSQIPALLGTLLPELTDPLDALEPAPARALRRYALWPTLAGLVPAVALVVWLGAAALPALLLPAAGFTLGSARFRAAAWRLSPGRLLLRSRRLARTTTVTDPARVQVVRAAATPFQRRAQLADFGIGVSSGAAIAVRHLDDATVGRLVARVSSAARGA